MMIERKSPLTGKLHTMEIDVTNAQLHAWKFGTLIQEAAPTLTAEEREFIMTGFTPSDWKAIFGEES